MPCYKNGGCGVYEMYSCSECPASKPFYKCKHCESFSSCFKIWEKGVYTVVCDNWTHLKAHLNIQKEQEEEKIRKQKEEKMKREAEKENNALKENDSLIKNIKNLFRTEVCVHIPCGSQRCDASDEWIEGCRTYQLFLEDINKVIKKYQDFKNCN